MTLPVRRRNAWGATLLLVLGACIQEYSLADLAETGPDGCDEGLTVCDGDCVNAQTSLDHCGACGVECDDDEVCEAGFCVSACLPACEASTELCVDAACECRPGLEACEEGCVDLESDWSHCGGCGVECDPAEVCRFGECMADCGPLDDCAGDCVDTDLHPLHCGACGQRCEGMSVCLEGVCIEAGDADPNACDACPCPQVCDTPDLPACCFDAFAEAVVCVAEGEC